MLRGLVLVLVLVGMGGVARADRLLEPPKIAPPVSTKQKVIYAVNELFAEMQQHLDTLSFERVSLELDARTRTGRFRFDGNLGDHLGLGVRSRIRFQRGYARLNPTIDLGLGSLRYSLRLPTIDLVPRHYGGQSYVEVRLPILRGSF